MPENLHFLEDIVAEVNSLRDPCKESFLTPSGIRRLFLLLLRGHWASGYNHGPDLRDSLSCLFWSPDKKESKVDIELAGTRKAREAGDTAIFVRVGGFDFGRLSFGDRSDVSDDNATVVRTFPTRLQSVIAHEHPDLDVAFDMAWSSFAFFSGYAEAISAILGEESSLYPEVLGEPKLAEDAPTGRYRVDFGMAIKVFVSVSTTQESHLLKRAFDKYTP